MKLKFALLWLIRTYQPISYDELAQRFVERRSEIPKEVLEAMQPGWFQRSGEQYLEELCKTELIRLQDGGRFTRSAKLVVGTLPMIQDLFMVSLIDLLKRGDWGISVAPTFGKPLKKAGYQDWAQIFVAMPFSVELRPVYEKHILHVTNALGLSCKRGDDVFTTNNIMQDVWSAIFHAELCIVDCTGRNPNVFYELGIAHTLGRKTVLITQTLEDIPFDVRSYRVIEYEYTPRGMQDFEDKLTRTLQTELR